MTEFECPRCGGDVPSTEHKGQYPGALSRVADVEICSLCGEDEAVASLLTGGKEKGLIPQSQWPIARADVERRMAPLQFSKEIAALQKEYLISQGLAK